MKLLIDNLASDTTTDDLLNIFGLDSGPLDDCCLDFRQQFTGVDPREVSLDGSTPGDGSPQSFDDDRFAHLASLSFDI